MPIPTDEHRSGVAEHQDGDDRSGHGLVRIAVRQPDQAGNPEGQPDNCVQEEQPGQSDLNPAVNAIQTLVVVKHAGQWQIALLQNTPAQFHGRPDLAEALTEELRQLL